MKTLISTLVVIAAFGLMGIGTASAQEELDKDKHSTIGEQLVPVGEHNKYEYTYKLNNISVNPMSLFWGSFSAAYSRALSDNFAVRGDVWLIHPTGSDFWGVQLSASVPIFFKKMNDGFFLEPGVFWLNFDSISGAGPLMMLGWSWIWDSGFNCNLAGGTGRALIGGGSSEETSMFSGDGMVPMFRLQFGYAF
jgi:hypothetical protein